MASTIALFGQLRETETVRSSDPWLAAGVALFLPVLLYAAHLAALAKFTYPAMAFLLAGYFYSKKSSWYAGFVVWLFCAAPFVRRLVDEQAGFNASSPVLLAPYVACSFAGFALVALLHRRPLVEARPFLVFLVCVGYGLILAIANGRFLSGIIDAMKWSAGPLFALYVILNADRAGSVHRIVGSALLIAVPLMSIYGIFQYLAPAVWDIDWVKNIQLVEPGLASMGTPIPYGLRVFSTMNSPGSFAAFALVGILVALQRRFLLMLPLVALMAVALLLTQYRAIWGGTLLGVLYLGIAGTTGLRVRIVACAFTVVMLMSSSVFVPQSQQAISQRLESIGDLRSDRSGEDRKQQYDNFFSGESGDVIVGSGLAIDGISSRLDGRPAPAIDSGIILVFTAFGVGVGTLVFLGLIGSVAVSFSRFAGTSPPIIGYRAVAFASFCQIPFGSIFVGESGFCVWLFLGLAAARAHKGRDAQRLDERGKERPVAAVPFVGGATGGA